MINRKNPKAMPIPVVPMTMKIVNPDGTPTRQGQLLLEQLQDVASTISDEPGTPPPGAGPGATALGDCIRTINLFDLTPGPMIAPMVPVYAGGTGMRVIGVLRKVITADLVVTITRNKDTSPLFTFTIPASTPIKVDVVKSISYITFKDLDVLIAGITASDASTDPDGVATVTIEWMTALTSGSPGTPGGGGPASIFTAGGDLAGTNTSQTVVGIENVPLDASTVGSPSDGQVLTFNAASGRYKALTPAPTGVPTTRAINTTLPLTGGGTLAADLTLAVNNFTGDTGSGGAKGTVPAPAAGDAAANKFLKASGTWAVVPPPATLTYNEVPAGTMNGSNLVFTLANTPNPAGSVDLYLNGVKQRVTIDYTLSGSTITYIVAPKSLDTMSADYSH